MKGTLTEDPAFEKARQERDVLTLRKLLKNINFNYRRSKEPIKAMWQADEDFVDLKQQKMDLTTYFEKFKATKKVIEELNQRAHGHTVVEIICKEQYLKIEDIGPEEAARFIAAGKERILGMQLIMNTDCDKYGTLTKDYIKEYLGGINKYPKTL